MKSNNLFFSLFMLILFTNCNDTHNKEIQHQNEDKLEWVDLTHSFNESTIYWPNDPSTFKRKVDFLGMTPNNYFYSAGSFSAPEHGGTHIDAPIHFNKTGWTVDKIPLNSLIGVAVVIDVSEKAVKDKDYQITIQDVLDYEKKFGEIPINSIIIFKTGYGKFYPDRAFCLGTEMLGAAALPNLHFPGIHPDLAKWLVDNKKPTLVGIDTPSIDYGQSKLFETHRILLGNNIPGLENVANLDEIHSHKIYLIALPIKIEHGSGGPVRIIAKEM